MALFDIPGEALLLRMWETITEKGIGALLRPGQIRREGRARNDVRAEEMLTLAQAERHVEEIRLGKRRLGSDGKLHFVLASKEAAALPTPPEPASTNDSP